MPRMITVLEDCVRYRDGKKWKRRHCFLSKPDNKKRTVTMFITKQFSLSASNQEIDEKSIRQYLVDEITGFEHGRHVDKESHVMALIGCSVVYCIAFEQTETMFRWAETLTKLLTSVNFHVTLKKVSETNNFLNKVTPGIQGNLHVQLNRLCLIGEPADGNKFICEWTINNLVAVSIYDTNCEKIKKLQIRSNGKMHKGKGYFEFEIGLQQRTIFEDTFRTFLIACSNANIDFKTNVSLSPGPIDLNSEHAYSYSILCKDINGSNSENSSSLEKRSSEIPIPRSREHSGSDQRPLENVQIKIRKSHKNLQNVRNENHKHYSVIETVNKRDHDACLFPDDEEIEDQVHHRSQNLFLNRLSQESSGVYVNGASGSMQEADLSVRISIQDDSGNFSANLVPSTSNNNHDLDCSVLPSCQKTFTPKHNNNNSAFLTFYRNVNQNPLSLTNYENYYRLLETLLNRRRTSTIKKSNSFNCIHVPEVKTYQCCRKYSQTNFALNISSKATQQQFTAWKERISDKGIERSFINLQLERDHKTFSKNLLSNRLPFRSMKDFQCSMIRYLQSGNVCVSLFSYHHFLSLIKDLKTILRDINCKVSQQEVELENRNVKEKITRKSKTYNHLLERIESSCSGYDGNGQWIEPSILQINMILVFEIIDNILIARSVASREFRDMVPRHKSYFDTNPTIELNNDKCLLDNATEEEHSSPGFSVEGSGYLEPRPLLSTSCSTPDFRNYAQQERIQKLSTIDNRYQNVSPSDKFDTINHTFPKQNISLNKSDPSDNKEGSFKRFRRKYSPNIFIPFIRRKTSSTHSTLSEPICRNDIKEESSYYNISNQMNRINKKSLSVVLDSCPYVNVRQDQRYINISKTSGTEGSNDSSSYLNTDSSFCDDISYPEEIIDPSRNYGDLNFIKNRMRCYPHNDPENHNWLLRRSSLSIVSQKSLQNFGTSRSFSQSKPGASTISRVHSAACHRDSSFRSTDYINTRSLYCSPRSLQSCCPRAPLPNHRPAPRSLNYVTVIESGPSDSLQPLSVCTQSETNPERPERNSARWWPPPQSSPETNYCQIDLQSTYALRDIDRMLSRRTRNRDGTPDDARSFRSLEPVSDDYSVSPSSFLKDKKPLRPNKRSFRSFFSR